MAGKGHSGWFRRGLRQQDRRQRSHEDERRPWWQPPHLTSALVAFSWELSSGLACSCLHGENRGTPAGGERQCCFPSAPPPQPAAARALPRLFRALRCDIADTPPTFARRSESSSITGASAARNDAGRAKQSAVSKAQRVTTMWVIVGTLTIKGDTTGRHCRREGAKALLEP